MNPHPGAQHIVYNIKDGCDFSLSVLAKLGIVLLVKKKLNARASARVLAAPKHVDEIEPWS